MTNYKLLQLEPTPEMVEAAEDAYMPFGDMDLALRMAILAAPVVQGELDVEYGPTPGCKQCEEAMSINLDSCPECEAEFCAAQPAEQKTAPDVQVEPFAYCFTDVNGKAKELCEKPTADDNPNDLRVVTPLYTHPAPAEQQPELAKYQPCGCALCKCEHETQCQWCGARHCGNHPVGQFSAPAYLHPAPDVAELVEARGDAMRFALPEVVAWWDGESNITRKVGRPAAHNWHQRIDLIRLSDYKALQAECEKLRKDAERYRWLREYFCSTREDLDDLLVEACGDNDPSKLDEVIEAALAELKRQNKQPVERDRS